MKFCSECGSTVETRVPLGDNRPRHVCALCDIVHYQNPKIIAGAIAEWEGRVLLCKRAIEPRKGYWTIPAGFMENAETVVEAALRETREEACAEIEAVRLFGVYSLPHISQVYMLIHGTLRQGQASAGDESLEVGLFAEADIPWDELAFPVVAQCLKRLFADRKGNVGAVELADIGRNKDRSVWITLHH